jgi:hypothetical protein
MSDRDTVKIGFLQPEWRVGTVVQVTGNIRLDGSSSKHDLLVALTQLERLVQTSNELQQAGISDEITAALAAASQEAEKETPSKSTIVEKLQHAEGVLRGADKTVGAGWTLAKTIAGIGGWVMTYLS